MRLGALWVLAGWAVDLYLDGLLIHTALTDGNGAYRILGVEPNDVSGRRYELRFRAPGAGVATAMLGLGASPFTNGMQQISDIVVQFAANAGQDLTERSAQVDAAQLVVASTESMLPPDDPRPDEWNAELAVVLSTAIDPAEATERIDAVLADTATVQDDVIPPDPFAFTLTGRQSQIRLRIGNEGLTPLRIRVHAASDKLTVPEGDREVELAPAAMIRIRARARARRPSAR